jgi:Eco29kI restriction endonuclease
MSEPYDPLDKGNLAESLARAILARPVEQLTSVDRKVIGAGVYALYYTGDFSSYAPLVTIHRKKKFSVPIYVGKAVPGGARKGGAELDSAKGNALRSRLKDHARSITRAATTLKLGDFHVRHLIVDDIWIPLTESVLIRRFQPLWNIVVDGFGNNPTGGPRSAQKLSAWDILHPGRRLSSNLNLESERKAIEARIAAHFRSIP